MKMPNLPHSVYSTWGFHDELGDTVHLTEELAHSALDGLTRWAAHGLRQDYFHLDCFWFDPRAGYRAFHPERWPNGPDPVLRRAREMGMRPGLWYSTSGREMATDAWAASRTSDGRFYSLAEGPYADGLLEALLHAAREWGVRLFKFDFANFAEPAAGSTLTREENRRLSTTRFLRILSGLKAEFPDAIAITHCDFNRRPFSELIGSPMRYGPDRSLLAGVDRVFSGDPHHFSLPQTSLARNLDLFQDRQVWRMYTEGFPLSRVEDHGVIAGTTNTCHYRRARGFSRSHIGQLARGGRRDFFYGNPHLLSDEQLHMMARARTVFFDAFSRGLDAVPVAPSGANGRRRGIAPHTYAADGEPGIAPWHGYLTGEGAAGLLYVVNPGPDPVVARIAINGLTRATVLFHDAARTPTPQVQSDLLAIRLHSEQMALVGLGEYADDRWRIGWDAADPLPLHRCPAATTFDRHDGSLVATIAPPDRPDAALRVVAEVLDTPWESVQDAEPFLFGHQFCNEGGCTDGTSIAHELVTITARDTHGPLSPVAEMPDAPIWSGVTWVSRTFTVAQTVEVRVLQSLEPRRRIVVSAEWVEFDRQDK